MFEVGNLSGIPQDMAEYYDNVDNFETAVAMKSIAMCGWHQTFDVVTYFNVIFCHISPW